MLVPSKYTWFDTNSLHSLALIDCDLRNREICIASCTSALRGSLSCEICHTKLRPGFTAEGKWQQLRSNPLPLPVCAPCSLFNTSIPVVYLLHAERLTFGTGSKSHLYLTTVNLRVGTNYPPSILSSILLIFLLLEQPKT